MHLQCSTWKSFRSPLTGVGLCALALCASLTAEGQTAASCDALTGSTPPQSTSDIVYRSVLSRAYENTAWTMKNPAGAGADLETPDTYGQDLACMYPTYVSGLIYLANKPLADGSQNPTPVSSAAVLAWNTIRPDVLLKSPQAKFDVEISLNPAQPHPFADDGSDLKTMLANIDSQVHPDIWFFDFLSDAAQKKPAWVSVAISYAHSHGQLVGGNDFANTIPPGMDFVSFVDSPPPPPATVPNSQPYSGFNYSTAQISALFASAQSNHQANPNIPLAVITGHLQSNAQNGPATESCLYNHQDEGNSSVDPYFWSETTQSNYLVHWASKQTVVGYQFTFIYPGFYPLCPANFAYDPLRQPGTDGGTLYSHIQEMMQRYNPLKSN